MKILGISGSLRSRSYNTALLRTAKTLLPGEVTLEIVDIASLPLYSVDMEANPPEAVRVLKSKIKNADAILFATSEYNRSISAALKNAIEWGNRPADDNSWDGKPAAIISASTGPRGGVRAQMLLRQICVDLNVFVMNGPELLLGFAAQAFDADLRLSDETARMRLKRVLDALIAWSAKPWPKEQD